ncbi:arginine N-methyltransferase 2 [Planoprotostelium fungivorum]|uniref:Arginine N-methyltransferase 2 n=1 Tax=Planoprotostelium fungivorum TaxID=1890364 RepID=A0A2P6N2S5_9EUKA|nr:arginine N-methyltransferase 2 [Planoprotostelium fungivorum]
MNEGDNSASKEAPANKEESAVPTRTEEEVNLCKQMMEAASAGDNATVELLLKKGADVHYRDDKAGGHLEVVQNLILSGHPWNEVDNEAKSAGEYAEENGQDDVYNFLLEEEEEIEEKKEGGEEEKEEEAVQEPREKKKKVAPNQDYLDQKLHYSEDKLLDEEDNAVMMREKKKKVAPNQDYLDQKLHYSEDKLLDEEDNAVMMSWEGPLMEKHAELMCTRDGMHVMNVGFGLGLVDEALQKYKPASHTIVEAHPDVYARMLELGWDKRPGVKILFGRWQDVVLQMETYDGIFFDTFGEFWKDLRQFCELVPSILNPGGVYSFFNGLGGSNPFFHAVYCRIAEMEMLQMGLETTYIKVEMEEPTDK